MLYSEYIQSPEWNNKRIWALDRADHKCQICGSKDNLQVHHNNYERLGKELPSDLVVLCETHHKLFHDSLPKPKEEKPEVSYEELQRDSFIKVMKEIQRIESGEYLSISPSGWNIPGLTEEGITRRYLLDLRRKALQYPIEREIEVNNQRIASQMANGLSPLDLMKTNQGLHKQKLQYQKMSFEDIAVHFVKRFPNITEALSRLF